MFSKLRIANSKKGLIVAGLVLAAAAVFGTSSYSGNQALASTCDGSPNDVLHGGFNSPSNFITTVKSGHDNLGRTDLQAIYAAFGLTSADYTTFETAGKSFPAEDMLNGDIVVNGETVATASSSYGRTKSCQGTNPQSITIGSTTLWGNTNIKNFVSGTKQIPATVMFKSDGTLKFAVMNICGNPIKYTKVIPSYSCKALSATPVQNQSGSFTFTTNAPVAGNAHIAKVVYDFGDGHTQTVTAAGAQNNYPFTYTYAKSGTFTAKVTVYINLPGNNHTTIVATGDCIHKVTVTLPNFECLELTGAILPQDDKTKLKVQFVAKAKFSGNVTLTSGDFKFGDSNVTGGGAQNGVKPADATTVVVIYTYNNISTTTDFKANASASLHFIADGKAVTTSNPCPALVLTQGVTPECKPGVPIDSPQCKAPCTPGSDVPPTAAECQPPQLPKTGAGNTIAIFAATVIGGFLVYRQLLFRKHRAAFRAAEQGTSLLPLGDPLSMDAPLEDTPLAAKAKKIFRRKRHY